MFFSPPFVLDTAPLCCVTHRISPAQASPNFESVHNSDPGPDDGGGSDKDDGGGSDNGSSADDDGICKFNDGGGDDDRPSQCDGDDVRPLRAWQKHLQKRGRAKLQ